jgi:hypothetical protein
MTDGMFNYETGKWNPSRDDFVYSGHNSITTYDVPNLVVGGAIRKLGNTKAPFAMRLGGGAAEKIYRGGKQLNQWRNEALKSRALKRNPFPWKDMKSHGKKFKVKEALKTAARGALTKRGGAAIGTTIAAALTSGSNNPEKPSNKGSESNDWIPFNRRTKQRIVY